MKRQCTHTKPDGTPCGAYAMTGAEFCYLHNPAIPDEDKRLAQTRGGEARALTIAEPLPAMKMTTRRDAVLVLADTIKRVRSGGLDIRTANCIGVLTGLYIRLFDSYDYDDPVDGPTKKGVY